MVDTPLATPYPVMLPPDPNSQFDIEVVPDDSQNIIDLDPQIPDEKPPAPEFGDNLAEFLEDAELNQIGMELSRLFEEDLSSRSDWESIYKEGLKYLGIKYENRTQPFPGASGITHPLLMETVVRFQSNAIMEIFPSEEGPAKVKILGDITPDKEAKGNRVRDYINYNLTEVMSDYRHETEKLLFGLGFSGAAFRKVYPDPLRRGRPAAVYIPAEDFVMPYGASSLDTAPRFTHRFQLNRNDLKKMQVGDQPRYRDVDLGEPIRAQVSDLQTAKDKIAREVDALTNPDSYELCEMHCDYSVPGFDDKGGVAMPYVITFDRHSHKILAIRRNWEEQDENRARLSHVSDYHFIPGIGAYGFGLVHLVGAVSRGATSILRQLNDAGTLANLKGGFKSRYAQLKDGQTPIAPGEFRDVDIDPEKLEKAFLPFNYGEPSQTLFQLLQNLVEEGRRIGSITDVADMNVSAQAPVGTMLAMLERSLKIMSAVQARIHNSLHREFGILTRVIRDMLPEEQDYPYDVEGATRSVKRTDFDASVDVIPVSNPNAATMAQRVMQYQAALQMSAQFPQGYDQPELHRSVLKVLGIPNAEKIIPDKSNVPPMDPVSENMAVLMGQPVKAYEAQNHDAHLACHLAFRDDPQIAQVMGQNPQAQALGAALLSHINEHLAFQYRAQVEQALGVPLPGQGEALPADVEAPLSMAIAQAGQKVLSGRQQEAAQKQAQQTQEDPMYQLAKAELQVKASEVQRKAAADQQKAQLDAVRIQQQAQTEAMRIEMQANQANQSLQADAVKDAQKLRIELQDLILRAKETEARITQMSMPPTQPNV